MTDEQEETEADLLPDLQDSVVLTLLAASLVGKRVEINGAVSARKANDVVSDIETLDDETAVIVFNDNRRVRIDGQIKSMAVRWEPASLPGLSLGGLFS